MTFDLIPVGHDVFIPKILNLFYLTDTGNAIPREPHDGIVR